MTNVEVIDLWPIEEECWACQEFVRPLKHGLPVYEDFVLPNDWEGEWGGVPSCERCHGVQGTLTKPVSIAKFKELIGL